MPHSRRSLIGLTLMTFLAAGLRIYKLNALPPGLWFDEAWISLKARDVLATQTFQLYFDQFGIGGVFFPMIDLTALTRWLTGGNPLAVRYAAAALGVLSIPLTFFALEAVFRLDEEIRPARRSAAALLGAFALSLMFPHLLLSRVGFDALLPALTGPLIFAALAAGLRTTQRHYYLLCGFALGAALYGYSTARFLPVAVSLTLMWLALLARAWRRSFTILALIAGAALVIALPFAWFFVQNPAAFAVRAQATTYNTLGPGAQSVPLAVLNNLLRTLAGFSIPGFGDAIARHNIPGRPGFDPLLSLLFWVGVVTLVLTPRKRSSALLGAWAGAMLLPVILTDGAPVFTRLMAAMPALAGICALGGLALWDWASARSAVLAPALLTLGLLVSLSVTVYDYFVRWANDARLYDAFQIGDWQAATLARDRTATGIVYLSPNLIAETRPTFDLLLRGSAVRALSGPGCLAYFDQPSRPITYIVDALSDPQTVSTLTALFPSGQPGQPILHQPEPFPLFEIFEVPAGSQAADPPQAASGVFGAELQLIGYALNTPAPHPGDSLSLTLYWQALAQPQMDYTVFVHFYAPGRESSPPAAQSDSAPCYSTSRWEPGEIVMDEHRLTVPLDFPGRSARLGLGMYAWPSLERLPLTDANFALTDQRLLLAEIPLSK